MSLTYSPADETLAPLSAADAFWAVANDDDLCDDPASISVERCVQWLRALQRTTVDSQLIALVDDTLDDLARLGRFGRDMEDIVLGALASVEVAFEMAAA